MYTDNLKKKGYLIIKKFWKKPEIKIFENTIYKIHLNHALKSKKIKSSILLKNLKKQKNTRNKMSLISQILDKEDPDLAFNITKIIEDSVVSFKLCSSLKLLKLLSKILNVKDTNKLISSKLRLLVNNPSTKRLLIEPHHEISFYPMRKTFTNIWFPLFFHKGIKKGKNNGTLLIYENSHKKKFKKYSHYQLSKTSRVNIEISKLELKKLEKTYANVEVGDIIIFDPKLVHASSLNESNYSTYTINLRYFDFTNDKTTSSLMNANQEIKYKKNK